MSLFLLVFNALCYRARGNGQQIYPCSRIVHNNLHQETESWAKGFSSYFLHIVDRTWMVCTSVGGCPSHLSLNSMQQWMEDQTEVTKRIERAFGHGVYAVTSTQWIVARWQSTTYDSGSLALRHTSTAKSDSQCQCSASISLLVAWTLPTDSHHPVSHPWAPRQEEVTLSGAFPATASQVCLDWMQRAPGVAGIIPPPEWCSQGVLLGQTDLELNRLGAEPSVLSDALLWA